MIGTKKCKPSKKKTKKKQAPKNLVVKGLTSFLFLGNSFSQGSTPLGYGQPGSLLEGRPAAGNPIPTPSSPPTAGPPCLGGQGRRVLVESKGRLIQVVVELHLDVLKMFLLMIFENIIVSGFDMDHFGGNG